MNIHPIPLVIYIIPFSFAIKAYNNSFDLISFDIFLLPTVISDNNIVIIIYSDNTMNNSLIIWSYIHYQIITFGFLRKLVNLDNALLILYHRPHTDSSGNTEILALSFKFL